MISTIKSPDTLKRRASHIKRELGCKHHIALDRAAVEFGFQNFKHAQGVLGQTGQPSYPVMLSQWWFNNETRASGTETLTMALRQPLTALLKPHHLTEYLGGCRFVGDQGLDLHSGNYLKDDPDYAMRRLRQVARILEFCEITGLRPSYARRCYPRGNWENRPPMADHDHCWFDPVTRQYVLTTEPYPGRASRQIVEMEEWRTQHGFDLEQVRWGSIYGYGTELWLAAKRSAAINLKEIIARLDRTPSAFVDGK